ncbi:MAG TPA: sulfite exporter TauE/SafE family protein [Acetobacteraceae bacterium]|nr:sulfite exporter TauE/SafE family protein [Acetobacteraceae bacterium]
MLANCLHDLTAIGPGGVPAVALALFLAGLAGGVTHCAGMCAPFVLAQAGALADRHAGGPVLRRLSGAALLPYHVGRMLGYTALGGVAGGAAGAVTQVTGLRYVLASLLLAAAVLMLAQASHRLVARLPLLARLRLPALRVPGPVQRRVAPLLAAPTGGRGIVLGLMLSALPCGLLYAALAAAAATGSVLAGAVAMAAFVAGTVPALVAVAMLGRIFLRRLGPAWGVAGAAVFALNGVVLGVMALRLVA